MLGKLLKYETKATARLFLPLYGALLIFAIINKIFITINSSGSVDSTFMEITSSISMGIYVIIIIGIFALTFVMMVQRFYKNLLSDEGYLMFTLPVKPWLHIVSKLLVSIMWDIASVIFTGISVLILAGDKEMIKGFPRAFSEILLEIYDKFNIHGYAFIFEGILIMLLALITGTLMIYASIALGQLIAKHKLLGAFGAFLLLNTAAQIIVTNGFFIIAATKPENWFANLSPTSAGHVVLIGIMIINLLFGGIYFIITNYVISRKLNLE